MKKLALMISILVAIAALVVLAVRRPVGDSQQARNSSATAVENAYDYEARDVVVQQMGPDGLLQYQLEAKRIAQLPENGQLSAEELVIHHDLPGTPTGGDFRWTLNARQATLPESGSLLTLQGQVRAQGRPQGSATMATLATDLLRYNLDTQDLSMDGPVDFTWGRSTSHCGSLRMNIKLGTVVQSKCNATFQP